MLCIHFRMPQVTRGWCVAAIRRAAATVRRMRRNVSARIRIWI